MKKKSVLITYLLWFFLGFFGVHKFYLGKTWWGVAYLLTGGLFVIGWIIDIFIIPGQVALYNERLKNFQPGRTS